jgi:hypothetical protein
MGFIIGFPILLLTTIAFIIFYAITKKKIALIGICSIWGFAFLIVVTGLINDYYSQPIRLTKTDIIGDYRIDTNFFTRKNAKWQYDHYRFTITRYKEKIVYSSGPPDMWKVQNGTAYQVLKYPPKLFRGHKKFYYVFKSDYYGNMFFRKVDK